MIAYLYFPLFLFFFWIFIFLKFDEIYFITVSLMGWLHLSLSNKWKVKCDFFSELECYVN
jgi:hypothetical protein